MNTPVVPTCVPVFWELSPLLDLHLLAPEVEAWPLDHARRGLLGAPLPGPASRGLP